MTPSANTSFTGQIVMSGCFRETSENMRDEVTRKLESIEQLILESGGTLYSQQTSSRLQTLEESTGKGRRTV